MASIISGADTFGLLAALAGLAAVAVALEQTQWGKRLSAPVLIIVLAAIAAQLKVLPSAAPLYDQIWSLLVPLAVALFLIKADLFGIVRESGRVLIAFIVGAIGVIAGSLLGAMVFDLGPNEASLVGVFSATYTGGSLNFAAVAEAVNFRDPDIVASAVAIDNVFGTTFLLLLNGLAGWSAFKRYYEYRTASLDGELQDTSGVAERSLHVGDVLTALAIAAAACAAGNMLASLSGISGSQLLFTTAIMVAAATFAAPLMSRISGEDAIALGLMYIFFAMIGAGVDIGAMLREAPSLFLFVATILIVHTIVLLGVGKLLKLNYAELIVASIACIMGPPVAAAIAVLFGWRGLVVPGVMTGVLGYAVGNFIGVGLHGFVSAW
ncbi:MAG: DUF819 family protein [Pseudomonadota bacterium]